MNLPRGQGRQSPPVDFSVRCDPDVVTVDGTKALETLSASLSDAISPLYQEIDQLRRKAAQQRAANRVEDIYSRGKEEVVSDSKFRYVRTLHPGNNPSPVHSVAIEPDTGLIATASWNASVSFRYLDDAVNESLSDEKIPTFSFPGEDLSSKMGGLYDVAFTTTKDDRIVGCTSADKNVYLWSYEKRKLVATLTGHKEEVNGLSFHKTQQVMCTASDDKTCIIWDFDSCTLLRELDDHPKEVYGATFFDESMQFNVATCCNDRITRIFDMRNKNCIQKLHGHSDDIIGIDFFAPYLATGADDGLVNIYDVRKWSIVQTINTSSGMDIQDNEVKRIAFSPCGKFLAAACSARRALVYDLIDIKQPYAILPGHEDCVFDVAWATHPQKPNMKVIVTASHDHTCRVFEGA